jgi:phosphatidylglycerophosphatase A
MSGRKSKPSAHANSPHTSTAWLVATIGGLGQVPLAPGTVGSVVGAGLCLSWLGLDWPLQLIAIVVLTAVAIVASGRAAEELGQPDPPAVIIDEIVGMWVAAFALPFHAYDLGAVFLLFRMFDVVKPAPIPRLERLPGGLGIVADDLAAGLLARATWWLLKANFDFF